MAAPFAAAMMACGAADDPQDAQTVDEVPRPMGIATFEESPADHPPPAAAADPDDGLAPYPAWDGVDLDCRDVPRPVRVTGRDPHRLDRDGDGVGCEPW